MSLGVDQRPPTALRLPKAGTNQSASQGNRGKMAVWLLVGGMKVELGMPTGSRIRFWMMAS